MKFSPLKLRTKITLYFLGLLFLWNVLILHTVGYLVTKTCRRLTLERGAQMAHALFVECSPFVHYEDFAGLAELCNKHRHAFPDLRYIFVLNHRGKPLWSSFIQGIPAGLLTIEHAEQVTPHAAAQLVRLEGEMIYDWQCQNQVLTLRVGISLTPVQNLIHTTIFYLMIVAIFGFLTVVFLALFVSKPIEDLTATIERAVLLDQKTDGKAGRRETLETTTIARHFQELLNRLEERTRQLDTSKKLAYLGQISTALAHEMNNPLGVVLMNGDFLVQRCDNGEFSPAAEREVKRLCIATKKVAVTAQKLIQFARYSSHETETRHHAIHLSDLLQDTLEFFEDRLRQSGCVFSINIPDDLPKIWCDERGIQQVLFNLLSNALDATHVGQKIEITVSMQDGMLVLQVADEGDGMSEAVLQHLKEPFFTTKSSEQGTGLGLAIADAIIASHGGQLYLESQLHRGTRATVRIPLRNLHEQNGNQDRNHSGGR